MMITLLDAFLCKYLKQLRFYRDRVFQKLITSHLGLIYSPPPLCGSVSLLFVFDLRDLEFFTSKPSLAVIRSSVRR